MKAKKKAKNKKYNPTAVIDATTSKNERDELRGVDYTQSIVNINITLNGVSVFVIVWR
jgi:hypothetical protein